MHLRSILNMYLLYITDYHIVVLLVPRKTQLTACETLIKARTDTLATLLRNEKIYIHLL